MAESIKPIVTEESQQEEIIRFTGLLIRETCAALEMDEDNQTRSKRVAPSVVLTALAFLRQISRTFHINPESCANIAETCVFIASKAKEARIRLKDIARRGRWVEAARRGFISAEDTVESRCQAILETELRLLALCGFVIEHHDDQLPHRFLYFLAEVIVSDANRLTVSQSAWAYLNDAAMLDLSAENPLDVACSALALAAQDCGVELPVAPIPYWDAVGANKDAIERIAFQIYELVNEWRPPRWLV